MKYSEFKCDCDGPVQNATCNWTQQGSVVDLGLRSGQESGLTWKSSVFSRSAVSLTCVEQETTIVNNQGVEVAKPTCPALPEVANGNFLCAESIFLGSICKLVCDDGFLETYETKNKARVLYNLLIVF